MDKQELNIIKQDVRKLKASLKKLNDNSDKAKEKIQELEADIEEYKKNIEETEKLITEKEIIIKKDEFSPVLQKLDDAVFEILSKRETEQLTEFIYSGKLFELLSEADNVATSSNVESANTNDSNEETAVVTSSNDTNN